MGQDGSRDNRWVVWVMGHVFDGSRGSWVTLYDPFAALKHIITCESWNMYYLECIVSKLSIEIYIVLTGTRKMTQN